MCRHLAYLGPPASLREVLYEPPHSLYRQSWAPRRQRYGTVNADGFGVGWYDGEDPRPPRYRRAAPMWTDDGFAEVARVTRTGALLAAVRCATDGTAPDPSAAAPYRDGRFLFSHNGIVPGWPASVATLAGTLPAELLLELEARTDSALLWALVRDRLASGQPPGDALGGTVRAAATACSAAGYADAGRYNLLLTDGSSIAATAYGDTLAYRCGGGAVVVASEPDDDDSGWVEVPDRSLLVATAAQVRVAPIGCGDGPHRGWESP